MNKLIVCIEELRDRIQSHRDYLSADEYRTRASLIDPLLCALGWDVADPVSVALEYRIGGQKADYALLDPKGKPVVVIEGKRLGQDLQKSITQMLTYAVKAGIPYCALTDGDHWSLFDVFKRAEWTEKQILDISIDKDEPFTNALKLLCLWKPSLESGQVTMAKKPIVLPPPPPNDWISLSDYEYSSKSKPTAVKFWNGDSVSLGPVNNLLMELAELLYSEGLLGDKLPYKPTENSKRYLIHTAPIHTNDTPFVAPKTLSGGKIYLETNYSGKDIIRFCKKLVNDCGKHPKTDVHLKLPDKP